jgi:hypothetical protein
LQAHCTVSSWVVAVTACCCCCCCCHIVVITRTVTVVNETDTRKKTKAETSICSDEPFVRTVRAHKTTKRHPVPQSYRALDHPCEIRSRAVLGEDLLQHRPHVLRARPLQLRHRPHPVPAAPSVRELLKPSAQLVLRHRLARHAPSLLQSTGRATSFQRTVRLELAAQRWQSDCSAPHQGAGQREAVDHLLALLACARDSPPQQECYMQPKTFILCTIVNIVSLIRMEKNNLP